jgi:hypothetical protein
MIEILRNIFEILGYKLTLKRLFLDYKILYLLLIIYNKNQMFDTAYFLHTY